MSYLIWTLVLAIAGPGAAEDPDASAAMTVLRENCYGCHGPDKQKARLRLDQAEGLLSVVVPGKPAESELLRRASLPAGHDDAMPPEGPPLETAQIEALRRWIAAGATTELVESGGAERAKDEGATRALLERVAAASGARLLPGASADPGRLDSLRAEFAYAARPPDRAALAALAPVADRIVELGLAGTGAASGTLADLPPMPRLERAHLERTSLGDEDVAHLVECAPGLRYLNLHSTGVTDARVANSLARLEILVLYDTSADPQAAGPSVAFEEGGPRRILIAEHARRFALLRETALGQPELLWEREDAHPGEVHWTGENHILFQDSQGLIEVDTGTGETVLRRTRDVSGGALSFLRLENEHTVVTGVQPARLFELDELGREVGSTLLEEGLDADVLIVRATEGANLLVAYVFRGLVAEYDSAGSQAWSFQLPGFGHGHVVEDVRRLDGGSTLIASRIVAGDGMPGRALIEVAPDGRVVWSLEPGEVEGLPLHKIESVQPLSTGNLALVFFGAPHLVEITREKEVVWTLPAEGLDGPLTWAWIIEDPYRWGKPK